MKRPPRGEVFGIERLEAVLERAPSGPGQPGDGVVISGRRLRALFEAVYEELPEGIASAVVWDAMSGLDQLLPTPAMRCFVRAPEGACDVLEVEGDEDGAGSTCVGCGWDAEDHDPAVQEASRAEAAAAHRRAELAPDEGGEG